MSHRSKIVIVDDDAGFRQSTSDLLEAHGYEVFAAENGEAGMQLALKEKPDLMVLDVMMAHKTEGFDVSRRLAQVPELRDLKILLVTGIRQAEGLPHRVEPDDAWLPVEAILEKPVAPSQLLHSIQSALHSDRWREEC